MPTFNQLVRKEETDQRKEVYHQALQKGLAQLFTEATDVSRPQKPGVLYRC